MTAPLSDRFVLLSYSLVERVPSYSRVKLLRSQGSVPSNRNPASMANWHVVTVTTLSDTRRLAVARSARIASACGGSVHFSNAGELRGRVSHECVQRGGREPPATVKGWAQPRTFEAVDADKPGWRYAGWTCVSRVGGGRDARFSGLVTRVIVPSSAPRRGPSERRWARAPAVTRRAPTLTLELPPRRSRRGCRSSPRRASSRPRTPTAQRTTPL